MILKALLLAKQGYTINQMTGRHVVDCVRQAFQQSLSHVDNLEVLEMCVSNMIQWSGLYMVKSWS